MSGGALRTFETRIPRFFPGVVGSVEAESHARARYQCYLNVSDVIPDLKLIDVKVKLAANPTKTETTKNGGNDV